MKAYAIYVGIKVSKGHEVYTATSLPRNDIFRAIDSKGEHTVLAAQEVLKVRPEPSSDSPFRLTFPHA
jgi:hypothetical protein